jgi:hypothetical protein
MLPQTKGAKFLYDSFLKDFLKKNESKIDQALNDAKRTAGSLGSEIAAATAEISKAGMAAASEYASSNHDGGGKKKNDGEKEE